MPLTLRPPKRTVKLAAPIHVMSETADPNWRKVEAVASRFALPSHRTDVRIYLYSVLRDVEALRRFGDRFLYPRRLKGAIRRGKTYLDEARRNEPAVFTILMAEIAPKWGRVYYDEEGIQAAD